MQQDSTDNIKSYYFGWTETKKFFTSRNCISYRQTIEHIHTFSNNIIKPSLKYFAETTLNYILQRLSHCFVNRTSLRRDLHSAVQRMRCQRTVLGRDI